ncbi:MAG TPA: aldehyde dehydrogenase family protein [Candidatus Thermoplasmatota archaeon]|nr:aldehyde dehydrogenase family protein [Candidatus Thermoplasmatota archaeon]
MQTDVAGILRRLGIQESNLGASDGREWFASGDVLDVRSPADGKLLAKVRQASEEDYDRAVAAAHAAFLKWRLVPAPQRGIIVREIGEELRKVKDDLGALVSLEMGKILTEGKGEVQEMIDVADFAVGLSRQLYGNTMQSERPGHRMYEQWHPLGVVGIVTAFNFPVAVWSWNSLIAMVCGDSMVWKPSSEVPLTAIACQRIAERVLARHGHEGVSTLVIGPGRVIGERIAKDHRIPLVSFTGSTSIGGRLAQNVSQRYGRLILELGGNNAIIVTPSADLEMATRAIVFGAAGTAGQRCTTTRRVIVHESVAEKLTEKLVRAYRSLTIGHPLEAKTLVGPLVTERAVTEMMEAIEAAKKQGGKVLVGGKRRDDLGQNYVEPTILEMPSQTDIVKQETFAPILYVMRYRGALDEAIAIQNGVPQGLSSSIFTTNLLEAEQFLSVAGSDCGIANVNIGTSGAEIGGAFGGEKETGGGRESGSDSWKQYMRRQTNTINYTTKLPLAQGVEFDVQ